MAQYSFTGFLNEKPKLEYSQKGTAFTRFSVCESWRKKDGDQWVETAHHWWKCTAFNDIAEICATFTDKCRVGLTGMLKYESWNDKETGELKTAPVIIVDFMGLLWVPKPKHAANEDAGVWGEPPDISTLPF